MGAEFVVIFYNFLLREARLLRCNADAAPGDTEFRPLRRPIRQKKPETERPQASRFGRYHSECGGKTLPAAGLQKNGASDESLAPKWQRVKDSNYKIALLAYLFDCIPVFFDLFSGKYHPLLC